jgi:hypothetical protein
MDTITDALVSSIFVPSRDFPNHGIHVPTPYHSCLVLVAVGPTIQAWLLVIGILNSLKEAHKKAIGYVVDVLHNIK